MWHFYVEFAISPCVRVIRVPPASKHRLSICYVDFKVYGCLPCCWNCSGVLN
uniref:Uncharacterized protein n=1 Tax=Anguilla anguilla TaxID=7936 RepID=A0A0E9WBK0_ANGAN